MARKGPSLKQIRESHIESSIFHFNREEINKRLIKRRISYLTNMLLALIISIAVPTTIMLFAGLGEAYYNKKELHNTMTVAIHNNADLRAIKQLRKTFQKSKTKITDIFENDDNRYNIDIPLNEILENIRTELYISDSLAMSSDLMKKLNGLIVLHEQVNPFDKLEDNQKDYFENIRIKLGESYLIASNDLNKISDELYDQNQLVAEYLSASSLSFWVSISALLFAVIISALQLYQNRSSKFHSLVSSAALAAIENFYKNNEIDEKAEG